MKSFIILTLSVLAGNVLGAPTTILEARGSDSVSATDLSNFELYSQYAAAAYCNGNSGTNGDLITCPTGNCPLVEAAKATSIVEFEKSSLFTDVTGFLSLSPSTKTIVLSFRGSHSIRNFLADIHLARIPSDICATCVVHQGFWLSWLEARGTIVDAMTTAVGENPDYQVVITGHSLGGAIAVLAAAETRKAGINAALYTYGQPRVGDEGLDKWMEDNAGAGNFRVTHRDDPVANVPSLWTGYTHISPEYWFQSDSPTPQVGDFTVIEGDMSTAGNGGTNVLNLDIGAHLNYFGNIAGCGSGITF